MRKSNAHRRDKVRKSMQAATIPVGTAYAAEHTKNKFNRGYLEFMRKARIPVTVLQCECNGYYEGRATVDTKCDGCKIMAGEW